METFWLLRICYPNFSEEKFRETIPELLSTQYSRSAQYCDSPWVTHCVSAVRYLIEKSTWWQLPYYYVWDMCRKILENHSIDAHLVPIEEGKIGDLIFFHRKSVAHKAYMITHVGILVDEDSFFHSSWSKDGSIEKIQSRMHTGTIATCRQLSSLTDPRSKKRKTL